MKRTGRLLFLAEDRTHLQFGREFIACNFEVAQRAQRTNNALSGHLQEDENDEKFECCHRKSSRDRLREVAIVVISLGEFWCFGWVVVFVRWSHIEVRLYEEIPDRLYRQTNLKVPDLLIYGLIGL